MADPKTEFLEAMVTIFVDEMEARFPIPEGLPAEYEDEIRDHWENLGYSVAETLYAAATELVPPTETGFSGRTVEGVLGEAAAFGEVLYRSSGKWYKAKGDAEATVPARVMCVQAGAADATVTLLRWGYVYNSAWSFSDGDLLYVSVSTGGALQTSPPAVVGQQAQVVGTAEGQKVGFFDFSPVVAEKGAE